jgi:hypothetical protein
LSGHNLPKAEVAQNEKLPLKVSINWLVQLYRASRTECGYAKFVPMTLVRGFLI